MLSKVPQHWLVFEVVDTGCGIAPEGLQSLFKEYVQVRYYWGLHVIPLACGLGILYASWS